MSHLILILTDSIDKQVNDCKNSEQKRRNMMLNPNRMRQAFVDDQPVTVGNGATAQDLLSAQGITGNRSLVQMTNSGKPLVLNPNDTINTANGQRFISQVQPEAGR